MIEEPSPSEAPEIDPSRFVRFGVVFYGAMALAAVLWRVGWYHQPIWWVGEEAYHTRSSR